MSNRLVAGLLLGLLVACQRDAVSPSARPGGSPGAPEFAMSAAAVEPTTAHGMNFLIISQADNAFCIAVDAGNTVGRNLTIQQCGTVDNQRWMFTNNSDNTNFLIDNVGMCVDGHFSKATQGATLTVAPCQSGGDWKFSYTSAGLLQNVRNQKCLAITGAASGAPVPLADCDATKATQRWALGH